MFVPQKGGDRMKLLTAIEKVLAVLCAIAWIVLFVVLINYPYNAEYPSDWLRILTTVMFALLWIVSFCWITTVISQKKDKVAWGLASVVLSLLVWVCAINITPSKTYNFPFQPWQWLLEQTLFILVFSLPWIWMPIGVLIYFKRRRKT